MKVVYLEFIDEFKTFEEYISKNGLNIDDFLIIALEPKLEAYLNSRNISYHNTLTYFSDDSHKLVIVETEKIMENIRQYFDFNDTFGLAGCYQREYTHYIRVFVNHILKVLEILNNVYNKKLISMELYAHVSGNVSTAPLLADNERYSGILAREFAKSHNLEFIDINGDGKGDLPLIKKDGNSLKYVEKLFIKTLLWVIRKKKVILIPNINSPFNNLISEVSKRNRKIVFLAVNTPISLCKSIAANASLLFRHLFFRNQPFYFVANISFIQPYITSEERERLAEVIDRVTVNNSERLFNFYDVDYSKLIKNKVELALKPHLMQMLSYSHAFKQVFTYLKDSLVMSCIGSGIMAVAGEFAKVIGRNSLFISHGAHPVPIDNYHELELNTFSRTFMLGDFTHVALSVPTQEAHLHYFKNKYSDIDNKEVKTGPLIFADIKAGDKYKYKKQLGIPSDTITITHAVTTKARCGERFHFLETLDEFLSGLTDVVLAIDMLSNVKLIIRIHPGFYLNNEEIKSFLPDSRKYIINREGPFSCVLGASDLLLSYSSTAIEEALINGIPVILYDKWNRYNHFNTGIYEDDASEGIFPVCYVNNKAKLVNAMQFVMKKLKENNWNINLNKYRYDRYYRENLFKFIKDSISL